MKWRVASASARGSSHLRSGLPNQDACEYRNGDRASSVRAVLAVSDGHGGARHFRSQVGSSLAALTAVNTLQDALGKMLAADAQSMATEESLQPLLAHLCRDWRSAVESDLKNNPFTAEELDKLEASDGIAARESVEHDPILAYGATLLGVAATDGFLVYLQLGDGDILEVGETGATARPLSADERLIGNQTTSLCQEGAENEFRIAIVSDQAAFPALVLVSTDGYANSFRSEEDFLKIGNDYLEMVRNSGIDGLAEELPQILAEASEQGSGDDITLGVLERETLVRNAPPIPARSRESNEYAGEMVEAAGLWRALGLVTAIAMVAGSVYAYRQWTHSPAPVTAAVPVAAAPVPAPAERGFVLDLSKGTSLELHPGDSVPLNALQVPITAGNDAYAEVRRSAQGEWELVNLGSDTWTVQRPGKHKVDPPVGTGSSVPLRDAIKITFRDGVSATVRMVDRKH